MGEAAPFTLGVVIVSFRSGDVIPACLDSLLASHDVRLKIVVVDNASPDDTVARLTDWAGSALGSKPRLDRLDESGVGRELGGLTLIQGRLNRGYAGGVNLGLAALTGQVDAIWVLNPDCVVAPDTARLYADAALARPDFGLMSCRTLHHDHPDVIQSDGGRINRATGVCSQVNAGLPAATTPPPDPSELDWLTGANLVVSPGFLARVGPMRDDYFLYFEEVDWAFRRGDAPLVHVPGAKVYHHAGTSIGSGGYHRRPSAFANFFNHRNRLRFARQYFSPVPIAAYAYSLAKAAQLVLKSAPDEAWAIIAGSFELPPPREVGAKFTDPETRALALGRSHTVR
ncbi:glycosyltransferase family 2 protein [Phenylobacterium sp.]|jgi:GT2 family glycosyltransferase|uniref:glycosyltransferase family 2 protein n=1 Tax=Phenylobacterium sp. TaxID=1871053 RepID=UPI0037C6B9C8